MQLSNMFLAAINYNYGFARSVNTLHKQLFILWAACSTFYTEGLSKMFSTEKIIESHLYTVFSISWLVKQVTLSTLA